MRQSLQLKIGQQLTMTPQLQQAIKLLQLSSLDLHQEIQQALYSNPLLELVEEVENTEPSENPLPPESAKETDDWDKAIPTELPVDAKWDDIFPTAGSGNASAPTGENRDFENFHSVTESLHDHLHWQLNLTPMSETDRAIAMAIIDSINPEGFLEATVEEIHEALGMEDVEPDEVTAVLHRIQQFDPPGVAAADLRECLLIQLSQFDPLAEGVEAAKCLVTDHLKLVAERNIPQLARKTGLDDPQVRFAIQLIQTLSPRPGDAILSPDTEYVVPDVHVRKMDGRWQINLNTDVTPRICINENYASMVRRADDSADNTFLRNHLQEARWFLRSLESRNETLLRVAVCIVEMQKAFLEKGPEAMRPMVLADVARELDLHESTISRVTTQKYLSTPQGVFELKYFFSSHVSTAAGGECSSTAIRAMLKKMIAGEPPKKPLSDSKLATLLQEQGIQVARRTVAKYRESLGIPTSSERRRYKQSA